jgi:hypothetical protein
MIAREPAREQKAFAVRIFFRWRQVSAAGSERMDMTLHLAAKALPDIT